MAGPAAARPRPWPAQGLEGGGLSPAESFENRLRAVSGRPAAAGGDRPRPGCWKPKVLLLWTESVQHAGCRSAGLSGWPCLRDLQERLGLGDDSSSPTTSRGPAAFCQGGCSVLEKTGQIVRGGGRRAADGASPGANHQAVVAALPRRLPQLGLSPMAKPSICCASSCWSCDRPSAWG